MKNATIQEWLSLSDADRCDVQKSWNTYAGDGKEIIHEVSRVFKEKYQDKDALLVLDPGIYHGGDWVIGVTIKIGSNVELPESFLGIRVNKGYKGLSQDLARKLQVDYKNDAVKFAEGEIEVFKKYFPFMANPNCLRENTIKFISDFVRMK